MKRKHLSPPPTPATKWQDDKDKVKLLKSVWPSLNEKDPASCEKLIILAKIHLQTLYDHCMDKPELQGVYIPEWVSDSKNLSTSDNNEAVDVLVEILREVPSANINANITDQLDTACAVFASFWSTSGASYAIASRRHSEVGKRPSFAEVAFDSSIELAYNGQLPSAALLQILTRYSDEYEAYATKYHSPYTTIVTSSGTGKSFTVKHLAVTQGTYVVYSSLSAANGSAIPPSTSPVRARMLRSRTEIEAETFWWRYMKVGVELVHSAQAMAISPADLYGMQSHRNFRSEQEELASLLDNTYWAPTSAAATIDPTVADDRKRARQKKLESILKTMKTRSTPSVTKSELLCVVCLDEALSLIGDRDKDDDDNTHFRAVRHALRDIRMDGAKVFGLLLATSSKVSNFAPTPENDPSIKDKGRDRLFAPIHHLATWDIVWRAVPENRPWINSFCLDEKTDDKCPGIYVDLDTHWEMNAWRRCIFTLGRPLWPSIYGAVRKSYPDMAVEASHAAAAKEVFELATTKLDLPVRNKIEASIKDLGLLSVRVSFDVQTKEIAERLVSHWMHHIVNVSSDRRTLRVTRPSEPVLACAAAHLMKANKKWPDVTREFATCFSNSTLNVGDIGEQVAAWLCLYAADECNAIPAEPTTVALQDWLKKLVPSVPCDWAPDNIRMYLTHVSRPPFDGLITHSQLQAAFLSGQAWFLERNFRGADLLIPLWDCLTKQMSALLIQVKNRADQQSVTPGVKAKALGDIRAALEDIPPLKGPLYGLYFNLRPPERKTQLQMHEYWQGEGGVKMGVVVGLNESCPGIVRPMRTDLEELLGWLNHGPIYGKKDQVLQVMGIRAFKRLAACDD